MSASPNGDRRWLKATLAVRFAQHLTVIRRQLLQSASLRHVQHSYGTANASHETYLAKLRISARMVTHTQYAVNDSTERRTAALERVQQAMSSGHVVVEVTSSEHAERVAFWQQGNLELNSAEALSERLTLRNHPSICEQLHEIWLTTLRSVRSGGSDVTVLNFEGYSVLFSRVYRVLMEDWDPKDAAEAIAEDWNNDRKGANTISRVGLGDSLFEAADMWTTSIEASEYVAFLSMLHEKVSFLDGGLRYLWKDEAQASFEPMLAVTGDSHGQGFVKDACSSPRATRLKGSMVVRLATVKLQGSVRRKLARVTAGRRRDAATKINQRAQKRRNRRPTKDDEDDRKFGKDPTIDDILAALGPKGEDGVKQRWAIRHLEVVRPDLYREFRLREASTPGDEGVMQEWALRTAIVVREDRYAIGQQQVRPKHGRRKKRRQGVTAARADRDHVSRAGGDEGYGVDGDDGDDGEGADDPDDRDDADDRDDPHGGRSLYGWDPEPYVEGDDSSTDAALQQMYEEPGPPSAWTHSVVHFSTELRVASVASPTARPGPATPASPTTPARSRVTCEKEQAALTTTAPSSSPVSVVNLLQHVELPFQEAGGVCYDLERGAPRLRPLMDAQTPVTDSKRLQLPTLGLKKVFASASMPVLHQAREFGYHDAQYDSVMSKPLVKRLGVIRKMPSLPPDRSILRMAAGSSRDQARRLGLAASPSAPVLLGTETPAQGSHAGLVAMPIALPSPVDWLPGGLPQRKPIQLCYARPQSQGYSPRVVPFVAGQQVASPPTRAHTESAATVKEEQRRIRAQQKSCEQMLTLLYERQATSNAGRSVATLRAIAKYEARSCFLEQQRRRCERECSMMSIRIIC